MSEEFDPSDWPENFQQMRDLDNLLRCPVCFEYFNTAMVIPQCSHTYCSRCIRRYINYKSQCPTCSVSVSAPELKNNRLVDEIIKKYQEVRDNLVLAAKAVPDLASPGRPIHTSGNTPKHNNKKDRPMFTWLSSINLQELYDTIRGAGFTMDTIGSLTKEMMVNDLGITKRNHLIKLEFFLKNLNNGRKPVKTDSGSTSMVQPNEADSVPNTPLPMSTPNTLTSSVTDTDIDITPSDTRLEDIHTGPVSGHAINNTSTYTNNSSIPERDNHSIGADTNIGSNSFQSSTNTSSAMSTQGINQTTDSDSVTHSQSLRSPQAIESVSPVAGSDAAIETPHFSSNPNLPKVPCPICGVPVKERFINIHLDRCLKKSTEDPSDSLPSPPPMPKRKRLPKLVYTLIKDKDLKKRLQNEGLSTQGDRKAMIKRHHEYTLLYNSECDAASPRPVSAILAEVERNEMLNFKPMVVNAHSLVIKKGAPPDAVEKAQKNYVKKHNSHFKDLIQATKERMKGRKIKPAESSTSSDTVTSDSSIQGYSSTTSDSSCTSDVSFNQGYSTEGSSKHGNHGDSASSVSSNLDNPTKQNIQTSTSKTPNVIPSKRHTFKNLFTDTSPDGDLGKLPVKSMADPTSPGATSIEKPSSLAETPGSSTHKTLGRSPGITPSTDFIGAFNTFKETQTFISETPKSAPNHKRTLTPLTFIKKPSGIDKTLDTSKVDSDEDFNIGPLPSSMKKSMNKSTNLKNSVNSETKPSIKNVKTNQRPKELIPKNVSMNTVKTVDQLDTALTDILHTTGQEVAKQIEADLREQEELGPTSHESNKIVENKKAKVSALIEPSFQDDNTTDTLPYNMVRQNSDLLADTTDGPLSKPDLVRSDSDLSTTSTLILQGPTETQRSDNLFDDPSDDLVDEPSGNTVNKAKKTRAARAKKQKSTADSDWIPDLTEIRDAVTESGFIPASPVKTRRSQRKRNQPGSTGSVTDVVKPSRKRQK
ncbi:unnamed protein product [Owenia fusiformis]|uniref:RING-type E3 ubiquitin transferase n=1 Tax=Owenia fusiformis TaxID=6347 RepID=A0A8S4NNU7_OWEFU|nr:unnamed protein product [Owenia fusiformis]